MSTRQHLQRLPLPLDDKPGDAGSKCNNGEDAIQHILHSIQHTQASVRHSSKVVTQHIPQDKYQNSGTQSSHPISI
jgi:hypothetical protein